MGSLGFAKALNRTLVLPPWVEYRQGELQSRQVPFNTYFQVNPLKQYHRVITMESFIEKLAPIIWPVDKRISFCYMERDSLLKKQNKIVKSCNAKEGNPFYPFWNTFNIDFIDSEFFAPLNYDIIDGDMAYRWMDRYTPEKWPVIAFTGAPASFPVKSENRHLHKYLIWSKRIQTAARQFIDEKIGNERPFIGIHLRNGIDWIRACEHVRNSPNLFAAAQCVGYSNEYGNLTMEICLPTRDIIIRQLRKFLKEFKTRNISAAADLREIRTIFVASDNDHMIDELNRSFHRMGVTAVRYKESNPHVDLAILGMANHFIGNCVSSFTGFAARERDVNEKTSSFWAFPSNEYSKNLIERNVHEEL